MTCPQWHDSVPDFIYHVIILCAALQECDEYAIRSQVTWKAAKDAGIFDLEMAPVEVTKRKKTETVDTDEHPRPETTVEKIGKLPPVFSKDGVVTAANASG